RKTTRTSGPQGLNLTEPPDAAMSRWCGRGEWATSPLCRFAATKNRFAGVCYTRWDGLSHRGKAVSRRCDGAHLSLLLCAEEPHERAIGPSHQGAISFQQYPSAHFERLRAGLCRHRVRYDQADVPRQTVRAI